MATSPITKLSREVLEKCTEGPTSRMEAVTELLRREVKKLKREVKSLNFTSGILSGAMILLMLVQLASNWKQIVGLFHTLFGN